MWNLPCFWNPLFCLQMLFLLSGWCVAASTAASLHASQPPTFIPFVNKAFQKFFTIYTKHCQRGEKYGLLPRRGEIPRTPGKLNLRKSSIWSDQKPLVGLLLSPFPWWQSHDQTPLKKLKRPIWVPQKGSLFFCQRSQSQLAFRPNGNILCHYWSFKS